MKISFVRPLAIIAAICATPVLAHAQEAGGPGCPEGSYDVVLTPDGGTVTILFSDFVLEADADAGQNTARRTCSLHIPLGLPADTSVGVYKVDYRGFAILAAQQQFALAVSYGLNNGSDHSYNRQIRGASEGDFTFSQTIGAGLMRRVGCGESAALDIDATISIDTRGRQGFAFAALDSVDGAPKGGLIYYLKFDKCTPGNR